MPIIPVSMSSGDAYKTLEAHLSENELKNLRNYLRVYLKHEQGKKVARRSKPTLTGRGTTERVDLPGVQAPSLALLDPETRRMYEQHVTYDKDKQEYVISYLYGRARVNNVFKGIRQEWVVSAKKKAIWKALESDFAEALSPISATKIKENVSKLATGIQNIDTSTRAIASYTALSAVIGTSVYMMNMFDQENFLGLKPEAILGAVPVYSVQHLERAKSDRKLKNRAIGDVFLAHQKGNKDILRLDLTLSGHYKYIYLWYLVALQKEGAAETQNPSLLDPKLKISEGSIGGSQAENKPHKLLNYEVHRTFPIITKNHIILSMYLQTIEWHQSVQDGKNVIKVHLLFRKYLPTGAYKVFNPAKDKEGNIVGGSGLELVEKFGMAKRWMEFTVDAVWKMMRMYGEMYGRMMIGDDGQEVHLIDQQAVSSMEKMITSYSGKFLGIL